MEVNSSQAVTPTINEQTYGAFRVCCIHTRAAQKLKLDSSTSTNWLLAFSLLCSISRLVSSLEAFVLEEDSFCVDEVMADWSR